MEKILEGTSFPCRPPAARFSPNPTILLAMKLVIILSIVACLHVSAKGYTQTVTFRGTNVTLKTVFDAIQQQTGLGVFIDEDILKETRNVTVDLRSASIEETLKTCFKPQPIPLDFYMAGRSIIVKKKNAFNSLSLVPPNGEPGLTVKAQGVVFNENNQPLSGANVTVKESGRTTLTNAKGEFSFVTEIPVNSILIVSYIGYASKQISAKGAMPIQVYLVVAMNELDATVIKGYYNTTQRLNTGNVTTIKGEDIQKQPVSDPLLALEGRVPGLYVQQTSGVPGAYSTVRLRGQNSLANGLNPLYIIDGVPFSSSTPTSGYIGGGAVGVPGTGLSLGLSPFNNLNISDIESISILKDADATAIYGSRGANGVILITTKKGKAGQTKVDLNVNTGWGNLGHKMTLLNTQQYLEMRHEAFKNDDAAPDPNIDFDLTNWDTTRYTNWQKVLIGNTAILTNAQTNISGGNANTQFLIGGAYSNQTTVFPGTYSDRKASAHINLVHVSTNHRMNVQFVGSYVNDNNNLPQIDYTQYILLPPVAPALYDANGSLNWQVKDGTATWNNPFANNVNYAKAITDNLISNLAISYQVLRDLQIKSSFGFTRTQLNQSNPTFSNSIAPPYNNNPYVRSYAFANQDAKSWIIEPQANYKRAFKKLIINALIGITFQQNNQKTVDNYSVGFSNNALVTNPLAASTLILLNYGYTKYSYNAIFGQMSINWQEKYLVNFTARRDGSSRFGPGKQFGNFGAVGAGWIFSKEMFIQKNLPCLSFGKLRFSYGTTGNDQLTDYQYLSTYSVYAPTYQGITGVYPTQLTNPYYAWEVNKKAEGGIELWFLKDKIMVAASYFRNRTDNQLVGYPLSAVTGFSSIQANLPATLQNTGWEFTFSSTNIKTENFTWATNINFSAPQSKLVSYPGIENSTYKYSYAVGKSLFSHYIYHYTGVNPQTGIYTFTTKNTNGTPSFGIDNIWSKPVTQRYYGGVENRFSFKNLQIDIFFQFVKQLGYSYLSAFSFPPGLYNYNAATEALSRWQKIGDNTNIQRFSQSYSSSYAAYQNLSQSDGVITDASFIRLKNVSLSYQLPISWQKTKHIQSARIYLQAQNLFTITSYVGLDPETQGLMLPPLRMVTVGFQVTL